MVLVITLLVVGLALLALEVIVLPGFGIMGVLGALSILGAGWIAFSQLSPMHGMVAMGAGIGLGGLMFWLLPKTRAAKGMVLHTEHHGHAADPSLEELLGEEGVALTPLRPAGSARINDRPVDVVTDGQYVEPGTNVRVTQVEGARVLVKPL
ncbi:MAG: hypothetical protein JRH20_32905 [Deltaproteobacteria bacterium]|nr:hypothetical protein [Deltaproteobacteria bacterium]